MRIADSRYVICIIVRPLLSTCTFRNMEQENVIEHVENLMLDEVHINGVRV